MSVSSFLGCDCGIWFRIVAALYTYYISERNESLCLRAVAFFFEILYMELFEQGYSLRNFVVCLTTLSGWLANDDWKGCGRKRSSPNLLLSRYVLERTWENHEKSFVVARWSGVQRKYIYKMVFRITPKPLRTWNLDFPLTTRNYRDSNLHMQRVLQMSWPKHTKVSINEAKVVAMYASGTECIPNKAEPADTLHGAEEGRKRIFLCATASRLAVGAHPASYAVGTWGSLGVKLLVQFR
jgi:hypothetical protein